MIPSEIRELFPLLKRRAYLFSGGIAPVSVRGREAIESITAELADDPGAYYKRYREQFETVRALFARLIGADDDEIALTESTGAGSNLAIEMVDAPPGSNVVFDELSYPSAVFPWMLPARSHVERRVVKMRDGIVWPDDIAEAVDERTAAISISHVSERTGYRHDIAELASIAHKQGAVLMVDAMQSVGALDFDVHDIGVDFLYCRAMKWLLGSPGLGFLYVARRHLDKPPPHAGGPGALPDPRPWGLREFRPKPGAERFQVGFPNTLGLAATRPGLEILLEAGMDVVEQHVLGLTGYMLEGLNDRGMEFLTPLDAVRRGGIVSVRMADSAEADRFLAVHGVDGYHYEDILRGDCHVFNDRSDIDSFLEALDEYLIGR